MFPYFNKSNSQISNQDYNHSFIKEINIQEDIPRTKRTVRLMIICWVLIIVKCLFIAWVIPRYKIPFSAWWITAPTLVFAAWVTAVYIWKE